MATLILGAAGAALGSSIGGTFLGVSATLIGRAIGGYVGRVIDQRLMGGLAPIKQEGPRLDNLDVLTSREGAALPDLSGRAAIAGEVIWATNLKETVSKSTKSAGSGKNKQKVKTTEYSYSVSLAISLCEGPVAGFGRIWLNDTVHDLSDMIADGRIRFYNGSETQEPDPLIASIEGAAPAYRGTAYIVFEDAPLDDFGNQIPNIKVEVFGKSGEVESLIRGVNIIPSSTEWGYMPRPVVKQQVVQSITYGIDPSGYPEGIVSNNVKTEGYENAVRHKGIADWTLSMDHLDAVLPNASTASLVVAWFGTDLRAGQCEIEPRVERKEKITDVPWSVSGLTRATANSVSQLGADQPSYGSSPADISVIEAIQDLKARGKRVVMYPFVMMDIPAGSALPNPYATTARCGLDAAPFKPFDAYGVSPALRPAISTDWEIYASKGSASYTASSCAITNTGGTYAVSAFIDVEVPPGTSAVTFRLTEDIDVKATYGGRNRILKVFGYESTGATVNTGGRVEKLSVNETVAYGATGYPGETLSYTIPVTETDEVLRLIVTVTDSDAHQTTTIRDVQVVMDGADDSFQPAYPWRGRITPAPGADVATEVAAFMGTAAPADFTVVPGLAAAGLSPVAYSGPDEWRFRRFILHLAHLAKAAGGVDAFLIGSEMRGLTMAPDGPGDYPFVTGLKALAADVKSVLPDAHVSYAADWSEYMNHVDGADLRFHLDPLWADANIDFVGIDNYLPVSDWRDGTDHADYDPDAGVTSPYDLDYLKANIRGGEYGDWYYASEADRVAQLRTPITDGAYGEPWVFAQKAIIEWHGNAHHERIAGVRQASPTAWVPGSKPIWFTEIGCPAVDKGGNQPNVFVDPKSSESFLPHFSNGVRDDFMQRQYLRATLEWWRDNGAGVALLADMQVWAWDARPWPEFPAYTDVWSDGVNWNLGHWLNGRAGAAPAAEMIARRLERHGLTAADFDLGRCHGQADGYPATGPIGFRDYLQPLEIGLALQANEIDGKVVVESRAAARTVAEVPVSYMVEADQGPVFTATRGALEDVASTAIVRFIDGAGDYAEAAARATLGAGLEEGATSADLPLVLNFPAGMGATERLLRAAADGRESIRFKAPRSATHIRPGAVVPVRLKGQAARPMIIDRVVMGEALEVEARSFNFAAFAAVPGIYRPRVATPTLASGAIMTRILDLPILPGSAAEDWDSLIACHADPWPGALAIGRSAYAEAGYGQITAAPIRAAIGELTGDLAPASYSTWTRQSVTLELFSDALVTREDIDVLSGENTLAVQHPAGWEILQFSEAELIGPRTWRISRLLRGRLGTEAVIAQADLAAGAAVVVLDSAVIPLEVDRAQVGQPHYYRIGPAGADVSTHVIRQHTAAAVGWRPYAPCHLKARASGGDVALTWVRRTREDGEADWRDGVPDVPLGEAAELYAVEVWQGGAVRHTAQVSAPSFTYTAAQAASDGVSAPYTLRVAQVSDTYGPGAWATLEIS